MTDDKAIEAALDAYYSALEWRKKPETYMHDMRAALAAADKVRAEGFAFEWGDETTHAYAKRAFVAGLAKGDADRAALVEALGRVLTDIADYERTNNLDPNSGRTYCWDSVANAHAVLALVRKGV